MPLMLQTQHLAPNKMRKILIFLILLFSCKGFAETLELTGDSFQVKSNRNDIEAILEELDFFLKSDAVERATGIANIKSAIRVAIPQGSKASKMDNFFWEVEIGSDMVGKETLEKVAVFIKQYLDLRWCGHSSAYAGWVTWSGLNSFPEHLCQKFPLLYRAQDQIAYPWVNANMKNTGGSLSELEVTSSDVLVVDGDLAWIFYQQDPKERIRSVCVDALEFNPAFGWIFSELNAEWKRAGKNKGKGKRKGMEKWKFFSNRLEKKYHIQWRSLPEVNSNISYD